MLMYSLAADFHCTSDNHLVYENYFNNNPLHENLSIALQSSKVSAQVLFVRTIFNVSSRISSVSVAIKNVLRYFNFRKCVVKGKNIVQVLSNLNRNCLTC